jgi:hypothetical protein
LKANVLGDIRAENDTLMLKESFYETGDYKVLTGSFDRFVVVGRRGTGKSALAYKLAEYWRKQEKTIVISVSPEEDQMIGLRGLMNSFGEKYSLLKAGSKIAWKYALYMEIAEKVSNHYKLLNLMDKQVVNHHIRECGGNGLNIAEKLKNRLQGLLHSGVTPEENISGLARNIEIKELEEQVRLISQEKYRIVLFIDRLDEGYEPDSTGVSLVDGFLQAVNEINLSFHMVINGVVFIRDNIFRSIEYKDPDFTRNTEGQVLRLHWDKRSLFNLVCNRLRFAYGESSQENNTRLWNIYTSQSLKGFVGFSLILRLTLLRPRDILVLLNNAFYGANSSEPSRSRIAVEDIEVSAKSISSGRLRDLQKEYRSLYPALDLITSVFSSASSMLEGRQVADLISNVLMKDDHELSKQRDLSFIEEPFQVIKRLYSIGFLGVFKESESLYVFSHDGRESESEIGAKAQLMIHPCYWLALNITDQALDSSNVTEVHDEYDVKLINDGGAELRRKRVGQLLEEVKDIEIEGDFSSRYEDWCIEAIKLIFAGSLSNIQFLARGQQGLSRDIIANNAHSSDFWIKFLEAYSAKKVLFKIVNDSDLSKKDYVDIAQHLTDESGKVGFLINRSKDNNLKRNEIDILNDIYETYDKKIIVKLSQKYFTKHLSKIRSPDKHDESNNELTRLLKTYQTKYLK